MGLGGTCVHPWRQHHQHPPPAPPPAGVEKGGAGSGVRVPLVPLGDTGSRGWCVAGERGGPAGVRAAGGGAAEGSRRWRLQCPLAPLGGAGELCTYIQSRCLTPAWAPSVPPPIPAPRGHPAMVVSLSLLPPPVPLRVDHLSLEDFISGLQWELGASGWGAGRSCSHRDLLIPFPEHSQFCPGVSDPGVVVSLCFLTLSEGLNIQPQSLALP